MKQLIVLFIIEMLVLPLFPQGGKFVSPGDRRQLLEEIRQSVIKAKPYMDINRNQMLVIFQKSPNANIDVLKKEWQKSFESFLNMVDAAIAKPNSPLALFLAYTVIEEVHKTLSQMFLEGLAGKMEGVIPRSRAKDFSQLIITVAIQREKLVKEVGMSIRECESK